jgi:hypothetical protein
LNQQRDGHCQVNFESRISNLELQLLGEIDESGKAGHCIAGSDRFPGEFNSFAQPCGFAANDQAGRGI